MKYIPYLYIGAFTFLIACSSEERTLISNTKGEVDSGIVELSAGIAEGSQRAATRDENADRHSTHAPLTTNTQLALYVSGTWTDHSPTTVIKKTTATAGAENSAGSKHNAVTCSPVIYWEDYGTSDLNNELTGRAEGLTIYGAAVDNKSLSNAGLNGLLADNADWTSLSWTLPANQTITGDTPADKDLLISNNVKGDTDTPYDGRYRFANCNDGKLLEFKHAMSKITVVLTAGAGFTSGFSSTPEVILTSNAGTPSSSWAKTTGTVNITNGTVSPTPTTTVITMWKASSTDYIVTKEALVMPHSVFGGNTGTYPIILRINADNNIYYVTSEMIRQAINGSTYTNSEGFETEAGKNYIINVRVNQTDVSVRVTATVANWTDVSATEVAPVINVSGNLGGTASGWTADNIFSFYRSEYLNSGYSSGVSKVNGYYPEESVLSYTHSSTSWSMSPSLYWPNHNTHYQFRAVWPQTETTSGDGVLSSPRVEDGSGTTASCQVIKVKNVAYTANSFPSDLMIARPNVANVAGNCGSNESNEVHPKKNLYTEGICARTGSIDLTFDYMMSQVEVNLSTSDGSDQVNLTNAKVEIVNVNNTGDVTLGNREVIPTGDKGAYTINYVSGSNYHSAIVPQTLTYTSTLHTNNVMFRITIYKDGNPSNGVDDIYYADINPILKQSSSDKVAPNGAWESGVHYVYNLRLTKTGVKVTASLTNWTTVNADHTVWF